jgi:hypothetical protein
MQKFVLSKPFSFEDKEYKELNIDLDSLTGRDIINAAQEARTLEGPVPVPELSKAYHAVIAAKAAKVPVEMLLKLPAKDFSKITLLVENFLLD